MDEDYIYSVAYVDRNLSLLVGDSEDRLVVVDAETLQPPGEPFDERALPLLPRSVTGALRWSTRALSTASPSTGG